VAEVHGVEVLGQDLLFGISMADLDREHRLLDLASEGLLVREIDRLHVLLSDRRATLDDPAVGDVRPRCAEDRRRRDTALPVEVVVLDRDDRVLEVDRDLVERHLRPVDLRVQGGDDVPVAIVHVRGLWAGRRRGDRQVQIDVVERAGDARDDDQWRDEEHPPEATEEALPLRWLGGPRRLGR
jgi:hypothetical protein